MSKRISNWLIFDYRDNGDGSSKDSLLPLQQTNKKTKFLKKQRSEAPSHFIEDAELTQSPISGTYIIKEWTNRTSDLKKRNGGESSTTGFSKSEVELNNVAASLVEITPQARARLERIPNRIGPYECKLCRIVYKDAFELAMHNCPRVVHIEYKCPECDKSFNCPANLASHKRWHKPKQLLNNNNDIKYIKLNEASIEQKMHKLDDSTKLRDQTKQQQKKKPNHSVIENNTLIINNDSSKIKNESIPVNMFSQVSSFLSPHLPLPPPPHYLPSYDNPCSFPFHNFQNYTSYSSSSLSTQESISTATASNNSSSMAVDWLSHLYTGYLSTLASHLSGLQQMPFTTPTLPSFSRSTPAIFQCFDFKK